MSNNNLIHLIKSVKLNNWQKEQVYKMYLNYSFKFLICRVSTRYFELSDLSESKCTLTFTGGLSDLNLTYSRLEDSYLFLQVRPIVIQPVFYDNFETYVCKPWKKRKLV